MAAPPLVALFTNHLAALLLVNEDLNLHSLNCFSRQEDFYQTKQDTDMTTLIRSKLGREEPREDLNTSKQAFPKSLRGLRSGHG